MSTNILIYLKYILVIIKYNIKDTKMYYIIFINTNLRMMYMGFAERLRSLREDNDEKQKDIAKLLNISNSMISFYESGIHFPRDEHYLIKLAEHFNVSMDYLFGLTDIPNIQKINSLYDTIKNLSPNSLKQLIDYIQYLKYKDKNAPQK